VSSERILQRQPQKSQAARPSSSDYVRSEAAVIGYFIGEKYVGELMFGE